MDVVTRLKEEAKECERIACLERDQAKIDLLIAQEERRRQDIARRLQEEILRLDRLRRV